MSSFAQTASTLARPEVIPGRTGTCLRTERLLLRPLETADREAFIDVYTRSRRHLNRFLPLGPRGATPAAIFDRQLEMTQAGERGTSAFRRIAVDDAGAIVGAFNLPAMSLGLELSADVAAWLAVGATGQGYAVEGLSAVITYAFDGPGSGLGLFRLDGWVQPDNTASQALARRLRFDRAPVPPEHLSLGDRWVPHERWSLPVERWPLA